MKKNSLLRGALALGLALSLTFSLVACSAPAAKDPQGSTPPVATPAPALSEEDYLAKLEELGTKMTDIQTAATSIDPTDVDAAKKLLDDMKVPFVDFAAITPPETFADAHAKIQAGCNGMIEYIDILLQIVEETDPAKQQELATKMVEVLTTAATNMTEGSELLAAAAG